MTEEETRYDIVQDGQKLNALKNKIKEVIRLVDELPAKKYPQNNETHEIEHAMNVLLNELGILHLYPRVTSQKEESR